MRANPLKTTNPPQDTAFTGAVGHEPNTSLSSNRTYGHRKSILRLLRARWVWIVGGVLLALFSYAGWVAYSFWQLESRIVVQLPPTPTAVASTDDLAPDGARLGLQTLPQSSPTPDFSSSLPKSRINILVMGTDKRPNDTDHYARSDSMIMVNLDAQNSQVHVMSIPRDLAVNVPGYGRNKINASYLFGEYYQEPGGGKALAVQTVSQLFNVPIDYYITVNFQGFRKLVDTVGGIDIDVPYQLDDFNYPSDDEGDLYGILHVHFDAGLQHMDGKTALRYARTRHADNDFMRSKRQLQVILATRRAAMSLNLIPTLPSLLDQLAGMVETNIPFDKQLALAQLGYKIDSSSIITSSIDSNMIIPETLPDGGDAFALDWQAAKPMLKEFFGKAITGDTRKATPVRTPTPKASQAGSNKKSRPTSTVLRTHTPAPTREPTVLPTHEPTAAPLDALPIPVPTSP